MQVNVRNIRFILGIALCALSSGTIYSFNYFTGYFKGSDTAAKQQVADQIGRIISRLSEIKPHFQDQESIGKILNGYRSAANVDAIIAQDLKDALKWLRSKFGLGDIQQTQAAIEGRLKKSEASVVHRNIYQNSFEAFDALNRKDFSPETGPEKHLSEVLKNIELSTASKPMQKQPAPESIKSKESESKVEQQKQVAPNTPEPKAPEQKKSEPSTSDEQQAGVLGGLFTNAENKNQAKAQIKKIMPLLAGIKAYLENKGASEYETAIESMRYLIRGYEGIANNSRSEMITSWKWLRSKFGLGTEVQEANLPKKEKNIFLQNIYKSSFGAFNELNLKNPVFTKVTAYLAEVMANAKEFYANNNLSLPTAGSDINVSMKSLQPSNVVEKTYDTAVKTTEVVAQASDAAVEAAKKAYEELNEKFSLLSKNYSQLQDVFQSKYNGMKGSLNDSYTWLKNLIGVTKEIYGTAIKMYEYSTDMKTDYDNMYNYLTAIKEYLKTTAAPVVEPIKSGYESASKKAKTLFEKEKKPVAQPQVQPRKKAPQVPSRGRPPVQAPVRTQTPATAKNPPQTPARKRVK